jgi:hypothetical protein
MGQAKLAQMGQFYVAVYSIDSLPLSRPKPIKSAENASIYAPHLKVGRP